MDKILDTVKDKQTNDLYVFGSFELDLKKRRLMCGGKEISLTPKEFSVLLVLVENAGRTVEKDELLEKIWHDAFVEESTLARNVSWLRKKLAVGGATDEKIIETVPKRGYRFVPEIVSAKKNAAIIEEEIISEIEIEESFEVISVEKANESAEMIETTPDLFVRTNQKILPAAPVAGKNTLPWILLVVSILTIGVIIFHRSYFSQNQSNTVLSHTVTPFSGLPGRETFPAFSPDGKQIAFAWDGGAENGKMNIYVKLVGAGEPVRLTTSVTDDINPVFSPDGKSIAFIRLFPTHNEIILIPSLGGAERKIYEKASYASLSFSPDGKTIAHTELDLSTNETGIFTINLQTGEKARVTTPSAAAVDHTPRFSPDGKNLAFIRYFNSFHREIFVVPAEGGEPRQITSDGVRIYGLAWDADSENLFFTSFRGANQTNLWRTAASENGEPQLIAVGGVNLQDLAVSPDGKTIAFVEELADENIWEFIPGDAARQARPLIRSTRADHSPQYSPDGTKIVFASERTGNYEIWLADADGKNQRQITDKNGSAGSPRFSPDGKFIVYDAQAAGGSHIYVVSINGGAARRLTEDGAISSLSAWSADGRTIFFVSNRSGADQIWKIPASGGAAAQVTKQGAFEMFAAPDNKTIIYLKGGGKIGLWSVGADGSGESPISELANVGVWRSWTLASNSIFYTAFAAQPPFQIRKMDLTTKQFGNVAEIEKSPLLYYSNLAVSPDGKKILYAQKDQSSSSIMLAELK